MNRISDAIYVTGVLNPNLRVFDVVMRTEYGTSYNSYVVRGGEKTAAIEAAHLSFAGPYLEKLKEVLQGGGLDYLVLNHCEPDHTGCVARLLEEYPGVTVVVSQAGAIYIKNIANRPDMRLQVVKDGDVIDLGGRTLRFINAPFLHWPDSMFTWVEEEKTLFSCDFLGAHYCEPNLYDTQITYPEAYRASMRYYYDCIFSPFKPYVHKGLEKLQGLDIERVCASHGPILTKAGLLDEVIGCYRAWSAPAERENKRIPIFYVSAYGNTGLLAGAIKEGISRVLPDAEIGLYDIIEHDLATLTAMLNESDAFLIGSPTINRDAVAPVWQLLAGIEAVNIQKRPAALFGSYGWSGEALPHIAERLASVKAEVFSEQFRVLFVPGAEDLEKAGAFGEAFAKTL